MLIQHANNYLHAIGGFSAPKRRHYTNFLAGTKKKTWFARGRWGSHGTCQLCIRQTK